MNELKKKIFDKLNIKYKEIPTKIIERVNLEFKLIESRKYENLLLDLISIKEILSSIMLIDDNIDKENYTITGSINDLFIAYLLGITMFNPIEYKIPIPKKIRVGISLPEGQKDNFINRLTRKYHNKIKILTNTNYFVIDHDNELEVINNTNIINCSKGEIELNNNILIYLDEKSILTILNEIYRYKDIDIKYLDKFDDLKLRFTDTNHKTVFEELLSDDNTMFNYHFLPQESKEYELTYIKCYYPKIYYNVVINYMAKNIPIKILNKYKDNYKSAIKDYSIHNTTFEDETILSFYKLCLDAKNKFNSFALDIRNKKPIFKNIIFFEHRVGNKMIDVLYQMAKERQCNGEVLISISDGDINWYISKFLSIESKIDSKEILSLLNPFNYKFEINNTNLIIDTINTLKESNIKILGNYEDIFDNKYDVIIIDSLDYLMKKINKSMTYLLEQLNELNKEVIIFDKVKDMFKVDEKIKKDDIKYFNLKKKYMNTIFAVKDGKIKKVIGL